MGNEASSEVFRGAEVVRRSPAGQAVLDSFDKIGSTVESRIVEGDLAGVAAAALSPPIQAVERIVERDVAAGAVALSAPIQTVDKIVEGCVAGAGAVAVTPALSAPIQAVERIVEGDVAGAAVALSASIQAVERIVERDVAAGAVALSAPMQAVEKIVEGSVAGAVAVAPALSAPIQALERIVEGDVAAGAVAVSAPIQAVKRIVEGDVAAGAVALSAPIQAVGRIVEGDVAGAAVALSAPIQAVERIVEGDVVAAAAAAVLSSPIAAAAGSFLLTGSKAACLQLTIFLQEVRTVLSSSSSWLSSLTIGDRSFGPFILALLFSEHQLYIKVVREALIEEARCKNNGLDQKVFVPRSDIDDPAWAEMKVKVYVVSQYGNYIDQDHTSAHKGIIIAYEDQSHKSEKFALHRFELDAEYEDDYKKLKEHVKHRHDLKQGNYIRAPASIPLKSSTTGLC